ncbi:hypothetical protein EGW08_014602 [Elysia chlorotica]|uniref:Uncharacterized protein n=1 Tax=Elysia chlorotica TaxID=188477 RepID=A0A433T7Q2_ELYCH|nr:hypothetical protein EGW08_014602 [Elysia chlorotica]
MSSMSSYKRKRIENWVEEVALYLRNGTICRSVIGHVAEDAINGTASDTGDSHQGAGGDGETAGTRSYQGSSSLTLSHKLDLAMKKSGPYGAALNGDGGKGVAGDGGVHNAFPVVKFAYSHYHEQRRKIDRLVQGLPVLNANGAASLDRSASRESGDEHAPIIFVNGEEPVRARAASQPRVLGIHHYGSSSNNFHHYSSSSNNFHHYSHAHVAAAPAVKHALQHQLQAPHTARHLAQPFRTPGAASFQQTPHDAIHNARRAAVASRTGTTARKLFGMPESRGSDVTVTVDPSLGMNATSNDRAARSKTAPSPNRNVHRARQRILTRRANNKVLEHSARSRSTAAGPWPNSPGDRAKQTHVTHSVLLTNTRYTLCYTLCVAHKHTLCCSQTHSVLLTNTLCVALCWRIPKLSVLVTTCSLLENTKVICAGDNSKLYTRSLLENTKVICAGDNSLFGGEYQSYLCW